MATPKHRAVCSVGRDQSSDADSIAAICMLENCAAQPGPAQEVQCKLGQLRLWGDLDRDPCLGNTAGRRAPDGSRELVGLAGNGLAGGHPQLPPLRASPHTMRPCVTDCTLQYVEVLAPSFTLRTHARAVVTPHARAVGGASQQLPHNHAVFTCLGGAMARPQSPVGCSRRAV